MYKFTKIAKNTPLDSFFRDYIDSVEVEDEKGR